MAKVNHGIFIPAAIQDLSGNQYGDYSIEKSVLDGLQEEGMSVVFAEAFDLSGWIVKIKVNAILADGTPKSYFLKVRDSSYTLVAGVLKSDYPESNRCSMRPRRMAMTVAMSNYGENICRWRQSTLSSLAWFLRLIALYGMVLAPALCRIS